MDLHSLLDAAQQVADAHAQAVVDHAEARLGKADAKLALEEARNAITLSLDTPETLKSFGTNAEIRAARLDEATADLAAALRDAERWVIVTDANERQAAIRAEHVALRVKIAALLARAH